MKWEEDERWEEPHHRAECLFVFFYHIQDCETKSDIRGYFPKPGSMPLNPKDTTTKLYVKPRTQCPSTRSMGFLPLVFQDAKQTDMGMFTNQSYSAPDFQQQGSLKNRLRMLSDTLSKGRRESCIRWPCWNQTTRSFDRRITCNRRRGTKEN
jgi:hypothetical protein